MTMYKNLQIYASIIRTFVSDACIILSNFNSLTLQTTTIISWIKTHKAMPALSVTSMIVGWFMILENYFALRLYVWPL